jgi:hypothetical protein
MDELYDLANDPHELTNLIDRSDYKQMLAELRQSLVDWMIYHEDSLLKQFKRMRIE